MINNTARLYTRRGLSLLKANEQMTMIAQTMLIMTSCWIWNMGLICAPFSVWHFKKKLRSQVCVALNINDWNEGGQSES